MLLLSSYILGNLLEAVSFNLGLASILNSLISKGPFFSSSSEKARVRFIAWMGVSPTPGGKNWSQVIFSVAFQLCIHARWNPLPKSLTLYPTLTLVERVRFEIGSNFGNTISYWTQTPPPHTHLFIHFFVDELIYFKVSFKSQWNLLSSYLLGQVFYTCNKIWSKDFILMSHESILCVCHLLSVSWVFLNFFLRYPVVLAYLLASLRIRWLYPLHPKKGCSG